MKLKLGLGLRFGTGDGVSDVVAPSVVITSTASVITALAAIPITITFSESVTGFAVGDITVANGTADTFDGSGAVYTANINPTAAGNVTVNIAAGVCVDGAGNANTAATQWDILSTLAKFASIPFTLTKSGGVFSVGSFNLRTYSDVDNAAGVDKYVDPAGNNTNGLTWATAYNDFYWATSEPNTRIIYCKAGFYNVYTGSGGWQGLGAYAKAIICVDATPAILCHSRKQTYSTEDAHWKSASTVEINAVMDMSSTIADGSYKAYTKAANVAGVDAVAGTWFWETNVLYVRTFDDRTPDTNIVACLGADNMAITATSNRTAYFENLKFLFGCAATGNALVYLRGNGATLNAYFKNCVFSHGLDAGPNVSVLGTTNAIFQDCDSEYSYTDGFNYHISTTIGTGIEINCTAKYAGYKSGTGTTQNGSSSHDAIPVIRINGDYGYTFGTPVGDVGGAYTWNFGCTSHHSLAPGVTRNNGFLVADGGPTRMWLDTCITHDTTFDLATIEGEIIYTRGCTLGAGQNYNGEGGGTVTPY